MVTLVLVLASAGPLRAAPHPERIPARLHRSIPRRIVREDPPRRTARSKRADVKEAPKPARKKTKAQAKPEAPARGRRSSRKARREPEPDNDPPLMHRASARRRRDEVRRPLVVARERVPAVRATLRGQVAATSTDDQLPQASENVVADVKELPATPAASGRGKHVFLPEDHAGRQAVIDEALQPVVLPTLYTRRGKLIVPPPLKGSRDILVHQNTMADTEGLNRVADDEALEHMQELHLLVPLRDAAGLQVNDGLPENRRYARPWAARFALDMARAYYARFHEPLHLNSAVRTVEYQLRLQRINGNAAAVDGDGASPHLTGQALDFGKRGMSMAQIAWMRAYLGILMRAGKIDVEEEFQQSCFHISVYKSYLPAPKAKANLEVAEKKPIVP